MNILNLIESANEYNEFSINKIRIKLENILLDYNCGIKFEVPPITLNYRDYVYIFILDDTFGYPTSDKMQDILDKLYDQVSNIIGSSLYRLKFFTDSNTNSMIIVTTGDNQGFKEFVPKNQVKEEKGSTLNNILEELKNDGTEFTANYESEGDIQYQLWIEQDDKIIHQGKVINKLENHFVDHTLKLKFSDNLDIDTQEILSKYRIKIFEYIIKERNESGDIIRGSQKVMFDKDNVVLDKFDDTNNTYEFIY